MVDDPYFQFPLCALAFGPCQFVRLNLIIDYCLVDTGWKLFIKLSEQERHRFLVDQEKKGELPRGFKSNDSTHCGALYGAHMLRVSGGYFEVTIRGFEILRDYIEAFERAHGKDARVRIRTTWLFDARDGRRLNERELPVLCGIYSGIGNRDMAQVTQPRIRRCALGYRTDAIMQAQLPNREDKAQPLTEWQLRNTIARLHENRFFARCTISRRITYYSIRLSDEALRKKVRKRHTYPRAFHASQSALDAALTRDIRQKRSAAEKATPTTSE